MLKFSKCQFEQRVIYCREPFASRRSSHKSRESSLLEPDKPHTQQLNNMADDEDIAALVIDNGSGMCKGEFSHGLGTLQVDFNDSCRRTANDPLPIAL